MRRPLAVIAPVVLVLALGAYSAWKLWPHKPAPVISGYVEGEPIFLSAAQSGLVSTLNVERGDRVAAGAPIFQIDPSTAQAQTAGAAANSAAAEAAARDTTKGQRTAELAVIQAQRLSAEASLNKARMDYDRTKALAERGVYSPAALDQARAALGVADAAFQEASRRLDVAELASRQDQQAAAQARADQARAGVTEAAARLSQLAPRAPADAVVEDVFFRPGEWAPANQPVVSLLPDGQVKLRFFVSETALAAYRPGRTVHFVCDGCKAQVATITYASPRAEFTPPVLYNRDQRKRLVFLIEARPERPRDLSPGQPVDVTSLSPGPAK